MSSWSYLAGSPNSVSGFDNTVNHLPPWTQALTAIVRGQLLVATVFAFFPGGDPTSFSIADTGSGGWQVVDGGNFAGFTYWKIATPADEPGITITFSAAGFTGNANFAVWLIDTFTSSAPGVKLDLHKNQFGANATTITAHPNAGSGSPGDVDELAYAIVLNAPLGVQGSPNTFTGTSPATNLALAQYCPIALNTNYLMSEWAGGVQPAAVAGSNTWVATWTLQRNTTLIAATFSHAESQQVMVV